MSDGTDIAAKGWQCGAVVQHAFMDELRAHTARPDGTFADVKPQDWLVIISQTCDVVANTLVQEPYVEMLHCRPIDKMRGQFRGLRSTRRLDFRPNVETHTDLALSAHAVSDRHIVPRAFLRNHSPDRDRVLSVSATNRLRDWFALRISRPAWPDSFVDRIKDVAASLEKALTPLSDDIAEVRVAIAAADEELPIEIPYRVSVYFVVDQLVWEDDIEGRTAIYVQYLRFGTQQLFWD